MPFPLWMALLIIGILALIAAYTIANIPPGIRSLLMFLGYAGVIIGVILLLAALLGVGAAKAEPLPLSMGGMAIAFLGVDYNAPSNAKVWFKSKTIWFNAVLLFIGGVDALRLLPYAASHTDVMMWLAFAATVGNLFLRIFATDRPISKGDPRPAQLERHTS